MAYTKFASDIFLSYRHLDNQTLSMEKEGWITRLHRDVEILVSQRLGDPVTMWRDIRLQGNDYFSETIEEELLNVAVMVSVISPGYGRSDWCRRELRGFLAAAEKSGGKRIGRKSRVFKVLKTPTESHEQPESLKDLLGYEFFYDGREFSFDSDPAIQRKYLEKLDDLATDIHLLLKEMAGGAPKGSQMSLPEAAKSVYLAWSTSDLNDSRDSIKRELLDRGYTVLPDTSPPLVADSVTQAVRQSLEQCCLSVHPIGGVYGMVPEGEQRSLTWLQHDLATERYKKGGFRRLLWIPPELEIKERPQQDLVVQLEREIGGTRNGFHLLKTPLEELKTIMLDQLRETATEPSTKAPSDSGLGVYLICERNDVEAVRSIEQFLTESGFNVEIPVLTGDPGKIREYHRQSLAACDAVLLYHGNGSQRWLEEKIRECRRAPGWSRSTPFVAQAIYVGPELTQPKREYQNEEFIICRNFDVFSPQALAPFISALPNAGAARQ